MRAALSAQRVASANHCNEVLIADLDTNRHIEVDNAPQDAAAQRDRQLETALATALKAVETAVRPVAQTRAEAAPAPLTSRVSIPRQSRGL